MSISRSASLVLAWGVVSHGTSPLGTLARSLRTVYTRAL